jgi:uncharacterized protein (TIGR03083 family)
MGSIGEATGVLIKACERTAALLERTPDLQALPARSDWTVQQIASHLILQARTYRRQFGALESAFAESGALSAATRRFDLVAENTPRDLAATLRSETAAFVVTAREADPDRTYPWHAGLVMTGFEAVSVLTGEELFHGYDIATAIGSAWPFPVDECLTVARVIPLALRALWGRTAEEPRRRCQILLAGVEPILWTIDGSLVSAEWGAGDVECTLEADPASFLIGLYGRRSWKELVEGGEISVRASDPASVRMLDGLLPP